MVLHNGKRIYEAYYEQMPAKSSHIIWSITKSMVGLLATRRIHYGRLDVQAGQRVVWRKGLISWLAPRGIALAWR